MTNICFFSLASYPLLSSTKQSGEYYGYGGAELKQVMIGKELLKNGYTIYFITFDHGKDQIKYVNGVNIIKSYVPTQNISIFEKIHILWNCLKKANSDIYIRSSSFSGITPIYCFIHRKKYLYWLSSDMNILLKDTTVTKSSLFAKIALYLEIKLASQIIVQNKLQKEIVEKKFKKRCILIKNPISIPKNENTVRKFNNDVVTIIWVGTIRDIKQPHLFLELAKECPQYNFKMIGGKDIFNPELYAQIEKKSAKIDNLEFIGFIPHHKINKYYEKADILVNTSKTEGFPNVFLEAWVNHLSVISLNVDPDEVICKLKMGFHSKTFEQMVIDVNTLSKDCNLRTYFGENGRKYVEMEHNLDVVTKIISSML